MSILISKVLKFIPKMRLNLQSYLEKSTIHGLVYTSKHHNIFGRIFWTFSLILSAFCTLWLIIELAVKMKNFPIVVYLSDKSVPVSKVRKFQIFLQKLVKLINFLTGIFSCNNNMPRLLAIHSKYR